MVRYVVIFLLAFTALSVMTACSHQQSDTQSVVPAQADSLTWPKLDIDPQRMEAVEARVQSILKRMALEEKIGQMIQAEIGSATPEDVKAYHLGSVLNGGGSYPDKNSKATVQDWLSLADAYYEASIDVSDGRIAIPIIWGTDAVHGHNNVMGATLFPHNIGLGAAGDADLVKAIGAATAKAVKVTGIQWNFAPTLAVVRDDRWGRTYEGYSEDPELVSVLSAAYVKGLQGEGKTLFGPGKVLATAKHFIADGGTHMGDDQGDALISEKTLFDIHAPGYYSALEAGALTVMASYSAWNGVRMHGHEYLLTDVLKNQMGFDGFIISDWNAIGHVKGCTNSDCAKTVLSGVDMLMVPGREDWQAVYHNLLRDVRDGTIPLARIDDAVARILRVKIKAGLFDLGAPSAQAYAGKAEVIGAKAHRDLAREAVRKSLVLLKNDHQLLPLERKQRVWIAGSAAKEMRKQVGGWSLSWQAKDHSNEEYPGSTLIADSIERVVLESGGAVERLSATATLPAQAADVAVVIMGEEPYAERYGDVENLGTLEFDVDNKLDLKLLRDLKKQGIPTVAIFLTGRPQWVNKEINAADAFVVAWLPGTEGAGVADVLFKSIGNEKSFDFSGQLSFSWPNHPCQAIVNKGDNNYQPAFAYGYGLTYKAKIKTLPKLPESNSAPVWGCQLSQAPTDNLSPLLLSQDQQSWSIEVGPYAGKRKPIVFGKTVDGVLVEKQAQSIDITWQGDEKTLVAFRSDAKLNLIPYLAQDAVLQFDITKRQFEQDLMVGVECGHICDGEISMADALKAMTQGAKYHVSVPLKCFAGEPAIVDFAKVSSPITFKSQKGSAISLANVALNLEHAMQHSSMNKVFESDCISVHR